jgi:rubrerythrin
MNTVDEILDYAIGQEQEAADFYAGMAQTAEKHGMKDTFMEFAREEERHRDKLLEVKQGDQELQAHQEVIDLKLSDYLVEVEADKDISYQDALIVAMKRERAAFQLYSDLAEKVHEDQLRQVFIGLAKEEAKHKLFFESEYDERVLRDN